MNYSRQTLKGYGVSFVLHRGETSTAPHLGQFLPGRFIHPHEQDTTISFLDATGRFTTTGTVTPLPVEHGGAFSVEAIRKCVQDWRSSVHVILTGSAQDYYLGTALSIFGREQDRLYDQNMAPIPFVPLRGYLPQSFHRAVQAPVGEWIRLRDRASGHGRTDLGPVGHGKYPATERRSRWPLETDRWCSGFWNGSRNGVLR
jgi:hypothetical protein